MPLFTIFLSGVENVSFTNSVINETFVYSGEVRNGLPNGQGHAVYYETEGLPEYQGTWKNGLPNGFGEFLCCDGFSYKGYWKDSIMAGNGTINNQMKVSHVDKIIIRGGEISANSPAYKCNSLDPPFIYTGMVSKAGLPNGSGTATFINSRLLNITSQLWNDCKVNWETEVHYRNGDVYRGLAKNHMQHDSKGLYIIDGVKYVGQYENDKAVGVHVGTYPDGTTKLVTPEYTYSSDYTYQILNFYPCEDDCE